MQAVDANLGFQTAGQDGIKDWMGNWFAKGDMMVQKD